MGGWGRAWEKVASVWKGRTPALPALASSEPSADQLSRWAKEYEQAATHLKSIHGGELIPSWRLGRPIYKDWSTANAIAEGLKATTWVYVCILAISRAVGSVPLRVQARQRDGSWAWADLARDPRADLLQALMDRPTPFMDRATWTTLLMQYLLLGGEGYAIKNRGLDPSAPPLELWLVSGDQLAPVPDARLYIAGYELKVGGVTQPKRQPGEDVVPFLWPDPAEPMRGLSPLRAGAKAVDSEAAAVDWQAASLQNMAVPSGIYRSKLNMTWDQFVDAKKKFEARHLSPENGRSVMFLDADTEFQQVSLSPKELDFVASRDASADEICALFGCPPPVVGRYKNATYNNVETAFRSFWRLTILPYVEQLAGVLNHALVSPDFGADLRLWPDTSSIEILNQLTPDMITTARGLWDMGVPLAEVNRRLGLGLRLDGVDGASSPRHLIPAQPAASSAPAEPDAAPKNTTPARPPRLEVA